jgi:oligopeptide/dipeptide ABC transporter ATP-binding protein
VTAGHPPELVPEALNFSTSIPILRVEHLTTELRTSRGHVRAVNDVSFDLHPGETLGLVGESGCGKSLTCLSLLRLLPDAVAGISGGRILLDGKDLLTLSESEMRRIRGRRLGIILQDPMTSLNPVLTIGDQIGEAIRLYRGLGGKALRDAVVEAMRRMRISAPTTRLAAYPHEMSGGMRQRVGGAIAMAGPPAVLIADEPTTALDATVQAQFLTLLKEVQRQTGLAILFVTHDFGIVANMCDRVAVMYAGRIVEIAPVRDLFERPAHPYTQALLRSVPNLEDDFERLYSIEGQPPAMHDLPPGCCFAPRCADARPSCSSALPPIVTVAPSHEASCWKLVNYGE